MASTHHQQAPAYDVAHNRNEQRLPPLRNLDFYSGSHAGPVAQTNYVPPPPSSMHPPRQEHSAWTRSAASPAMPSQHGTPMTARPADAQKPHYTSQSSAYASPQQPSLTTQTRTANTSKPLNNGREVHHQQYSAKRSHSGSSVSETPGRSPQTAYPPHAQYAVQPPQYQQPTAAPPPSDVAHHPPPFTQSSVGYSQYPQQMSQRQYHGVPPPPPPHMRGYQTPPAQQPSSHQLPPSHHPPSNQQHSPIHQAPPHARPPPPPPPSQPSVHNSQSSHHAPPSHQPPHHSPPAHQSPHQPLPSPQSGQPPSSAYQPHAEHWSHHPPPAPPQPQASAPPQTYEGYARNAPPMPVPIDHRSSLASIDPEKLASRQGTISKIVEHCKALYEFANRYANSPNAQPSPLELQEMSQLASTVVRLLEDLRRLDRHADQRPKDVSQNGISDEQRPPKRPWEEISKEEEPANVSGDYKSDFPDEQAQSAQADMELIRIKRASSSTVNVPGQPKSKYRKRSRATPPGKCHSCNIRETPEWRRGPDGARTLCNACGLHYAKLMRKRDKAGLGADGKPAAITIDTLRASTASARGAEHAESPSQASSSHHMPPSGPPSHPTQGPPPQPSYPEHAPIKPPPMYASHHPSQPSHSQPGSYHGMTPLAGHPPPGQHPIHHSMPPPAPPPVNHAGHPESGAGAPPPPWMASPSSVRNSYPGDHQSYMRTSHSASHARTSPH